MCAYWIIWSTNTYEEVKTKSTTKDMCLQKDRPKYQKKEVKFEFIIVDAKDGARSPWVTMLKNQKRLVQQDISTGVCSTRSVLSNLVEEKRKLVLMRSTHPSEEVTCKRVWWSKHLKITLSYDHCDKVKRSCHQSIWQIWWLITL